MTGPGALAVLLASLLALPAAADEDEISFSHDEETIRIDHGEAPAAPPPPAPGEPLLVQAELTAHAWADTAVSDADVHRFDLGLSGRLALEKRLTPKVRVRVGARLMHHHLFARPGLDDADRVVSEVDLREAWIDFYLPVVDLRVGNQIFAWGANEGFAPADVLNPTDLRFGFAGALGGTEGKLPVPAVRAKVHLGEAALRAVLMPVFVPNRLFLFGYDWGLAQGIPVPLPDPGGLGFHWTGVDQLQPFLLHTRTPSSTLRNVQAALRGTYRLAGVELGVSYFDGWDRFPRQTLDPDLEAVLAAQARGEDPPLSSVFALGEKLDAGQSVFESFHTRMRVLSADVQVPAGPLTVRIDAGFSPGRTLYATSRDGTELDWIEARTVSGAVGVEYLDLSGLVVGVVGHAFLVLEVPGDRVIFLVEPDSAPARERTALLHGVLVYARWTILDERLELVAAALTNTSWGDLVVRPGASWRFGDRHKLAVSAELLAGPPGSPAGLFGHNDQVGFSYTVAY